MCKQRETIRTNEGEDVSFYLIAMTTGLTVCLGLRSDGLSYGLLLWMLRIDSTSKYCKISLQLR